MAKIPRNVIDEIRNSVDIGDVIGRYVQLHQAGKNLIGLCPFHDEKTPSFSVNEEKQFFYCFGCHRSGNVFQFLMELKHIDFVDAVKEIANDSNIKIPEQYVMILLVILLGQLLMKVKLLQMRLLCQFSLMGS